MSFFIPSDIQNLYVHEGGTGWIGYIFPPGQSIDAQSISLEDSFNSYKGSYLFASKQPNTLFSSNFSSNIWLFLDVFHSDHLHFSDRCFLWLNPNVLDPNQELFGAVIAFNDTTTNYMATVKEQHFSYDSQRLWLNNSLFIAVAPYSKVAIDGNSFTFSRMPLSLATDYKYGMFIYDKHRSAGIRLGKIDTRGVGEEAPISIPLQGPSSGCLQFQLSFPFQFDNPKYFNYEKDKYPYVKAGNVIDQYTILPSGMKYSFDDTSGGTDLMYPLFQEETPAGFTGSLDFSDLFNQDNPIRTYFAFNGTNVVNQQISGTTVLSSNLATNFGKEVSLKPVINSSNDGSITADNARLVFAHSLLNYQNNKGKLYWTLQGNFSFESVKDSKATDHMLLCGLSGTETINFKLSKGKIMADQIAFFPQQPACAIKFPLNSGDKTPSRLLSDKVTTAWASVINSSGSSTKVNKYFSQPTDAPLFQPGSNKDVLDYSEVPSANLIAVTTVNGSFPLAPSANTTPILGNREQGDPGYYTQAQLTDFEIQILNPSRKITISDFNKTYKSKELRTQAEATDTDCPTDFLTTTPQGFLVNLTEDQSAWKCLTLANNDTNAIPNPLRFINIEANEALTDLQSSFQTNEQFLVISNPAKSDKPEILEYYIKNFQNELGIADWPFLFDITHQNKESNTDAEFTNIVIFKFCSGSIEKRIPEVNQWTNPTVFNDENTLPALIDWIQNYIKTAESSLKLMGDDGVKSVQAQGFKQFLDIVKNENWNGVLALQVTLDLESLPGEIKAILGGIDTSRFAAHHVGIEANQIKTTANNKLDVNFKSSLFGMIAYFNDTYLKYENGTLPRPEIYPNAPGEYDFQVLDLQILFSNSAITDFQSKIQLTLNQIFSEAVLSESLTDQGAIYKNCVVMNGQYDKKNGTISYTFSVSEANTFTLSSIAINTTQVSGIEMSTLDEVTNPKTSEEEDTSSTITTRFALSGGMAFQEIPHFDLFSYTQLQYTQLQLDMTFNLKDINPSDGTPKKTFAFRPTEIVFKQKSINQTREGSLVANFPIELSNLLFNEPEGNQTKSVTTSSLGYTQVNAPLPTAPVGDTWYGLRFNLSMGSLGALTSKVGLNAEVVLAWSPGKGNNQAQVYAKLPFSGGIAGTSFSVEGVIKFAIGSILFFNDPDKKEYAMVFTDVGISLLGKKLPPTGSTVLYLFGNPDNAAADDSGKSNVGWFAAYKN